MRTLPGFALALLLILASATATADDTTSPVGKSTWVGATFGLPVPIGSLVGLQLHRRFDRRNFVDVGVSSIGLVSGVSLSAGHLIDRNTYLLVGADADALFLGNSLSFLPGLHGGIGWEWFPGPVRTSVACVLGFPWLGGVRVGVAL